MASRVASAKGLASLKPRDSLQRHASGGAAGAARGRLPLGPSYIEQLTNHNPVASEAAGDCHNPVVVTGNEKRRACVDETNARLALRGAENGWRPPVTPTPTPHVIAGAPPAAHPVRGGRRCNHRIRRHGWRCGQCR